MSEEVPFKSLKITLSDEALDKLAKLRLNASMRSDSATIEECIRTFYDIVVDSSQYTETAAQLVLDGKGKEPMPVNEVSKLAEKVVLRAARFIPRTGAVKKLMEKQESEHQAREIK